MTPAGPVERVIVVPRNGLANRLQAWASAALLAQDLKAPLKLIWSEQAVAPVTADVLFAPNTLTGLAASEAWLTTHLGIHHELLPRYLSKHGDTIVLAGHDRGEQDFMDPLARALEKSTRPVTILIIAGGLFHLPGARDVERRRGDFYRSLVWSDAVIDRASESHRLPGTYAALHIRETDRSVESPPAGMIRTALRHLRDDVSGPSLFIAADTAAGLERWSIEAARLGWSPWSLPSVDHSRSAAAGAVDAAADWLLLGGASAIIYPAASTFSTEAAVAGGSVLRSCALRASRALVVRRRAVQGVIATVRYPERHWRRSTQARAASSH